MHLVSGRVWHYRSIGDSGLVEFDPEITNIVGVTGSGKTSFLKMLSGVSTKVQFGEGDLPHNSEALTGFHDGNLDADEIVQLEAVFEVEDTDTPRIPPEYRNVRRITVRRTFDGCVALAVDGTWVPKADIEDEIGQMHACAKRIAKCLPEPDLDELDDGSFLRPIGNAIRSLVETDFYNSGNTMLAIQSLKSAAHSTPHPRHIMIKLEEEFSKMERIRLNIEHKVINDPSSELYRSIPKPKYCDRLFDLEDEVDLDQFIKNPYGSKTFLSVAQICGLAPAGLARVRNARASERDAYLEAKSAILSSQLNQFWRQENCTFKLAMGDHRLRLHVKDKTAGTTTSLTERSDGFR